MLLNQTADDAIQCLKLLNKKLVHYDSNHSNYFMHTAVSHMRSDMRTAKDTAIGLKRVAHDIKKSLQPTELKIKAARNTMSATARAMDTLQTTARKFDQRKSQSTSVTGAVDNFFVHDDKEKHEIEESRFCNSDGKDYKEFKLGKLKFFQIDKSKLAGLVGKSSKEKIDRHDDFVSGGTTKYYHRNSRDSYDVLTLALKRLYASSLI
ncbi:hypothetical protein Plhal710r2_c003g0014371 [Plasmopara halstedii]